MRILQVIPGADSFRVFLSELVEHLLGEGHEVAAAFNPVGGIADYPVNGPGRVVTVDFPRGGNPFRYLKPARQLARLVDDFKPDVVHAHFSAGILSAALARGFASAPCAWLGTFQGLQFPHGRGLRGRFARGAECWSAARMDAVHVLTGDDRMALQRWAPKAHVRQQAAYGFGCHDRFFETPVPDKAGRDTARAALGLKASDRVFIFIGRLVAHKGFHHAARAFMRAERACPDQKWIVIGEVDPIHPTGLAASEWAAYRRHPAILRMGVQDDVLPFLDVADAMLFPTQREGMPVSVMEALARRTPVLTNRVRGCRELVRPEANGIFFESSEPEAMATLLARFQPFIASEPEPLTRRSAWIREMSETYRRFAAGGRL